MYVMCSVAERIQRLAGWMEVRFSSKPYMQRPDALEAHFMCLRDKQLLVIKAVNAGSGVQVSKWCRHHADTQ